jgi:3-oxoacyl-[acyl-carrier-protein] synthase-3
MRSLAVTFPTVKLTNEFFLKTYPDTVARAEEGNLARLFDRPTEERPNPFDVEMVPYLRDPFRGSRVRYVRAPDEGALSMELQSARSALAAAKLTIDDVDLLMVSSFPPDQMGPGNATYLARALGAGCTTWNFETACSSALVGFHTACSLVRSGEYRNVLVVVSNSNSLFFRGADSLRWFSGDGSAAFVVSSVEGGLGIIGHKTIPTIENIDMFRLRTVVDDDGAPRLQHVMNAAANQMTRVVSEPLLRRCVDGLLAETGRAIEDVDFFVFNSPTAWFPAFCARVLGIDAGKWISTYPLHGNIGAALMPATLYRALHERGSSAATPSCSTRSPARRRPAPSS